MQILSFQQSSALTIGVELELQIIDPHGYGLTSRSKDLYRHIKKGSFPHQIKPEITQSMIEINSDIHHTADQLLEDLTKIQSLLLKLAKQYNLHFCGGGTHPFQRWSTQKIFPAQRYKNIAYHYRYLSKRATVFGQHVHIGCKSGEEAIYLTHALAYYVPHFIALCASSPYYQGIDTGHHSARSTIFNVFPQSGFIPFLTTWEDFSAYYYKLQALGVIESMKDFYWDIRPKPEYGTVEVRVCDTPLTLNQAAAIAAYIQALSYYLLEEKASLACKESYYIYNYNRFQASRFGFDGKIINPCTGVHQVIKKDIAETLQKIEVYAKKLNSFSFLQHISNNVNEKSNDATILRKLFKQHECFTKLIAQQCKMWSQGKIS